MMKVAIELYNSGDLSGARLKFAEVLDARPQFPLLGHAIHAIATINGELHDAKRAVQMWHEFFMVLGGREFPPLKVATAYFNWGYNLRVLGDYEEALGKYTAALPVFRVEKQHVARCLQNMAWAQNLLGLSEEAEVSLNAAESHIVTTDDQLHQNIGLAFAYVDTNRAELAARLCNDILSNDAADSNLRSQAEFVLSRIVRAS